MDKTSEFTETRRLRHDNPVALFYAGSLLAPGWPRNVKFNK